MCESGNESCEKSDECEKNELVCMWSVVQNKMNCAWIAINHVRNHVRHKCTHHRLEWNL